jgi:Tol biopolymer transport system component
VLDIQEHSGQMFIVMEYVDGQTLRQKMAGLSLKQAVDIGVQVAEGLAAAHEKGIVHRDIKPENIMVRKDGIAQIMDFGLAKLRSTNSAITRLTKQGSTVGTAGYMSPEQVQGQDADHRSDIFSLGVLLFEMITGQLPFKGVHETAVAYEIVNVDAPPMSAVKPEVDPSLDAVVLECLEKDPRERTQSAGQVALELKRYRRETSRQRASRITAAPPVSNSSPGRQVAAEAGGGRAAARTLPWPVAAAAALVTLAAGYGIALLARPDAAPLPLLRVSVDMPPGITYADGLGGHSAISPDGSSVVFAGWDSLSVERLYVRRLDSPLSIPLAGTEEGQYPFWSPDGRSIGFFAQGKLKTVAAAGGPVLAIADAPFGRGGAWSPGGEIVFAPTVSDPNLYAVPVSGGTPRKVTAFDSTAVYAPRYPFFLPDGKHFLLSMLSLSGSMNESHAHVGSIDSRETKEVVAGVSHPQYAMGHIFYLRQGILMTQPFDPERLEVSGRPAAVQGDINVWLPRAKADYTVSGNGMLLYAGSVAAPAAQLVWLDGEGTETPVGEARMFSRVALSPGGDRVAYDERAADRPDIWIYDIVRKVRTRLTFATQGAQWPAWSHDGEKVYYNAEVGGSKANIHAKRSDGSGTEEVVARGERGTAVGYYPEDVSPDGRFLLLRVGNESGNELATVDLAAPARPGPVVNLGINGASARFSPDGRWIVYQANEAGTNRLYVSSFGGSPGMWQLPAGTGLAPQWRGNRITYYATGPDRYEAVDVSLASGAPVFTQGKPVFARGNFQSTIISGVSADGKRFLGLRPANAGARSGLSLIVNWPALVRKDNAG